MTTKVEQQKIMHQTMGLAKGLADTFVEKLKTFRKLEETSILFEEAAETILYSKLDKLLDKAEPWTERELIVLSSIFFLLAAGEEE